MKKLFAIPMLLFAVLTVSAQVKLPQLIQDGMILQRDQKIKLWGTAASNEKITINLNGKTYQTKADITGNWIVLIAPTKAGGPYTIEINASNKIVLHNILFGDVWFCSGQSNMVHQMNIHDVTYAKDIAEANYPQIRQFLIPTLTNLQGPQKDISTAHWQAAVGEGVRPFSAVAYFFAKKLFDKNKIPIGIINASVGGTPIEAWISEKGFKEFPTTLKIIEKNKDTAYINQIKKSAAQTNKFIPFEDAGLAGRTKWYNHKYVPAGWHSINIPGYWNDQGIKNLNGVVWYRREINIPETMTGKPATVFLGRIVDEDELYINGNLTGKTTYQYPQRRYQLAASMLKAGKNIFVIRVTNVNGKGGFVPDKPYCVFAGADTVDLKGTWQYKVGAVFKPKVNEVNAVNFSEQNQPAALYNAMTAPITNYGIKGFCWYQGESNTYQSTEYTKYLPALITDWRSKWGMDSLPFLYVQLPGFMEYNYLPAESYWALLRESQFKALTVSKTAMVVAIDLGEWNDIHPDNKKTAGERLALAAEKVAYQQDIVYSGPLYKSFTIEGNKISISFNNAGGGLQTTDGEMPAEFSIAGLDKKFVWANTAIEGNKIIVWSKDVTEPNYVRYGWSDNPVNPNLINKEGLPASPFRTDN